MPALMPAMTATAGGHIAQSHLLQRRVQPSAASAACRPPPVQLTVLHPLAGPSHAPLHMDTNTRGALLLCMAHPRRVAKVTSQMQRELGDMLANDPVVTVAICPERRMGVTALSAIASITHVYVSNDLQVVKVYVSVFSDDKGKKRAMDNLKRLEGYVRTQIGQRVKLRLTPEIRFEYDDTLEEMEMVQRVIGPEEVARYQREIEEEMAAANGTARPDSVAAGAGDDEDGFFDGVEEEEDEEDLEQQQQQQEEKAQQVPRRWTPTEQPYPDPFGDLFVGDGDQLVSIETAVGVKQRKDRRQRPVGADRRRR